MKLVAGGLTVVVLGLAVASGCLIDRRTSEFECDDTTDCADAARTCVDGFCILDDSCPAPCTSCNRAELTCNVKCDKPNDCGTVVCPAGFNCTIDCTNRNSCGAIDCSNATACDIQCSDDSACGNIDCGSGDCKVDCSGTAACGAVTCESSCECDVDCNGGDCASFACPTTGADCTRSDSDGCDSGRSGCSTCP